MITLWRYNTTTGYWDFVRTCAVNTAEDWLVVFQRDEPNALFKLSKHKPAPL